MNELIHNFLNQIEDVNKVTEISLDDFIKILKENTLIDEADKKKLLESFKKIASKKTSSDDEDPNEQRKKKNQRVPGRGVQNGNKETVNVENLKKEIEQDEEVEDKER